MDFLRLAGVDFAIAHLKLSTEQANELRSAAMMADERSIKEAVTNKRMYRPPSPAVAAPAIPAPQNVRVFAFSYSTVNEALTAEPKAPPDFASALALAKIPLRVFSLLQDFSAKRALEAREFPFSSYDIGRLQESAAAAGIMANRVVENLRVFEHSMNSVAALKKDKKEQDNG